MYMSLRISVSDSAKSTDKLDARHGIRSNGACYRCVSRKEQMNRCTLGNSCILEPTLETLRTLDHSLNSGKNKLSECTSLRVRLIRFSFPMSMVHPSLDA